MAMNGVRVISSRFPYLPLQLTIDSRTESLEALLDTGFDGDVVVPEDYRFGTSPPDDYVPAELADGSEIMAPAFAGIARIGAHEVDPVMVLALGDVPIIGVDVIRHFMVMLDHGRQVILEP